MPKTATQVPEVTYGGITDAIETWVLSYGTQDNITAALASLPTGCEWTATDYDGATTFMIFERSV